MDWGSTLDFMRFCVRLVVRAAVVTLTASCFLLIGVAFDWMVEWVLEIVGASEFVIEVAFQITLAYILAIVMMAALTGVVIVGHLTIMDMRDIFSEVQKMRDEGDDHAE